MYKERVAYQKIDKGIAIEKFKVFSMALGRYPNAKDFMNRSGYANGIPSYNYYIENFGSLDNICNICDLNLDISHNISRNKKIENSKKFILDFYNEFGHIPSSHEYSENRPKDETYSISKLITNTEKGYYDLVFSVTGVTKKSKGKYGYLCYDSNGDICKSEAERKISNFLIHNSINFEKETKYKSILTNFKNDNRRIDFLINGEIVVEYFGLYSNSSKSNIINSYKYKTRKKIKDLYKVGIFEKCIFIFPWDLKNRDLEDIFKTILD